MTSMMSTDWRMYATLSELIPLVEAKIASIESKGIPQVTPRGTSSEATEIELMALETLIIRLQQVKTWLEEGDPAFQTALRHHITDDNQRNQQRESRREWGIAGVTTIAGVILGWLSSLAATPATLWHLIAH